MSKPFAGTPSNSIIAEPDFTERCWICIMHCILACQTFCRISRKECRILPYGLYMYEDALVQPTSPCSRIGIGCQSVKKMFKLCAMVHNRRSGQTQHIDKIKTSDGNLLVIPPERTTYYGERRLWRGIIYQGRSETPHLSKSLQKVSKDTSI